MTTVPAPMLFTSPRSQTMRLSLERQTRLCALRVRHNTFRRGHLFQVSLLSGRAMLILRSADSRTFLAIKPHPARLVCGR